MFHGCVHSSSLNFPVGWVLGAAGPVRFATVFARIVVRLVFRFRCFFAPVCVFHHVRRLLSAARFRQDTVRAPCKPLRLIMSQCVHTHSELDVSHPLVPADDCADIVAACPARCAVGHDAQRHAAAHEVQQE